MWNLFDTMCKFVRKSTIYRQWWSVKFQLRTVNIVNILCDRKSVCKKERQRQRERMRWQESPPRIRKKKHKNKTNYETPWNADFLVTPLRSHVLDMVRFLCFVSFFVFSLFVRAHFVSVSFWFTYTSVFRVLLYIVRDFRRRHRRWCRAFIQTSYYARFMNSHNKRSHSQHLYIDRRHSNENRISSVSDSLHLFLYNISLV